MSRFVTAGGEDAPNKSSDAWAAAQAHLEALRNKPKLQDGKQEGGKSLYEVLQANKGLSRSLLSTFLETTVPNIGFLASGEGESSRRSNEAHKPVPRTR